MIQAFDSIEKAGEMNATDMASGIKVALITTVAGLIVAMFLQVFYNYIVAKIDGLVNQMEDSSITMVDMLIKHNVGSK
jgi:biopolymer transport protein ExbB